jgi:membrane protease YdiL (CAAX protease family)
MQESYYLTTHRSICLLRLKRKIMQKLTNWIKKYQVIAFFAIAFVISWGLAFSWDAVLNRDQGLLLPLVFLSACGPGLAGIIVSAVINTQPKQGPRKAFWIAFLVAWVMSALVCLANSKFIEKTSLSAALIIVFTISVVPVAFILASAHSRIPSVRSYLSSLIRLRGVWGWALLALVLLPALLLISIPVDSILNKRLLSSYEFPEISLSLIGLIIVKFFYQVFFFNTTGEETGWRGFFLPRFQARTSPLLASLIIGVFWASWHFFFWKAEGQPISSVESLATMFIGHILASVLIVWICNRAKGSILVAGFAHAALNTAQVFIPFRDVRSLYPTLLIASLVLVLIDRMWKKLPADHPAVLQAPLLET